MAKEVTDMRFRSRSDHTLDAKGRLNIPARFREVLKEAYTETLIVTNWEKCLRAYPVSRWQELEEKLLGPGQAQPGFGDFVRYVISGVTECTLDKQGRILLPQSLRGQFNIDKEVTLNGMFHHFEIWDRRTWEEETRLTRERFSDFKPGLSSLGIL